MKVLGISGSPRPDKTTSKLVQEVLAGCECDTEFLSLAGKRIGPCIACLRCVADNVCKVEDDLAGLRATLVGADAYVIGAANYYSVLNGLAHCFLERWYQFRHIEGKAVAGKRSSPCSRAGMGSSTLRVGSLVASARGRGASNIPSPRRSRGTSACVDGATSGARGLARLRAPSGRRADGARRAARRGGPPPCARGAGSRT